VIRKILQLASYVFAVAATVLGAISLVVFLNLKSELLELVNITNYNTFIAFDNAFSSKYIVFGSFAVCALSANVCLLVIVIGRSEVVKFVYVEKQKPDWVAHSTQDIQKQSTSIKAGFMIESFYKNMETTLHNLYSDVNYTKEHKLFNAICIQI
jgi:hypothetical protein